MYKDIIPYLRTNQKKVIIMEKNMGKMDRIIRASLAIGFIVAGFVVVFSNLPVLGIIFFIIGSFLGITSACARCPGYLPFGITTFKKPEVSRKKHTEPEPASELKPDPETEDDVKEEVLKHQNRYGDNT
jgi:hypothetical protein